MSVRKCIKPIWIAWMLLPVLLYTVPVCNPIYFSQKYLIVRFLTVIILTNNNSYNNEGLNSHLTCYSWATETERGPSVKNNIYPLSQRDYVAKENLWYPCKWHHVFRSLLKTYSFQSLVFVYNFLCHPPCPDRTRIFLPFFQDFSII